MKNIVKCPHCGAEYLTSEIFMPEDFLESVQDIYKNKKGKIEKVVGEDACLEETYICDHCNKEFKVKCELVFTYETMNDFEEEYSTIL